MVSPLTLPAFLPNMAAGQLAIELRARGPVPHTAAACASGTAATAIAALPMRADACDVAVADQVAPPSVDFSCAEPGTAVITLVVGAADRAGAEQLLRFRRPQHGAGLPTGRVTRTPDRRFALLTGVGAVTYCFRAVCAV